VVVVAQRAGVELHTRPSDSDKRAISIRRCAVKRRSRVRRRLALSPALKQYGSALSSTVSAV